MLSSVSIDGASSIQYNATDVELKAVPVTEGEPVITYAWEITTETANAALSATTGETVKLSVNNEAEDEVTVTVKVTATSGDTTKDATKNITVSANGVDVKNELTAVAIKKGTDAVGETLAADATATVTLTAEPALSGNATVQSYAWTVTDADSVVKTKTGEATNQLTLEFNNEATAEKTVTVKVEASDGTNTKDATVTITVGAAEAQEAPAEVKALWDFATAPTGWTVGTKVSSSPASPLEVPAVVSTGASLKIVTVADATYNAANEYGARISVGKNTGDYTKTSVNKLTMTLTLDGAAKVGLTYSGSGSQEVNRWIVIKNGDTEVWHDTNLSNTETKQSEIETTLAKGTYTLYMNGFYLYNLYATNVDFSTEATSLAGLKESLNLATISEITSNLTGVATVALGADGDSATITPVKPGFATLKATDGANHFAKIAVTVGIDGTITHAISKNTFTAKEGAIALSESKFAVDDELSVDVATEKLTVGDDKIVRVKSVEADKITLESVGEGTTTLTLTVSDGVAIEWKAVKVGADGTITTGDATIPFIAHEYPATLTELGFAESDSAGTVEVTPTNYADYIMLKDPADSTYSFVTKQAYSGDEAIVIKIPNNSSQKSAAYIKINEINAVGAADIAIEPSAEIAMENKTVSLTDLNLESILDTDGLVFATGEDAIATAEKVESGVKITAKAAGSTTLTVKESDTKTASIAITVAESGKLTLVVSAYSAAVTTTTLWNASNCDAKDYTENTVFAVAATTGTDKSTIAGFSVTAIASTDHKVTVDTNNKTVEDIKVKFTQRLKLNNPGSQEQQAIKFTLEGRANVTVYFMSGSKGKTRTVHIATASEDVSGGTKTSDGTESVPTALSLNLAPGDYYIYGSAEGTDTGGVNIYGILVKPPVAN